MALQAVILAIGTELSTGEIVNTNGAWIGERLEDLGFQVSLQIVVPDERQLMKEALTWAKQHGNLIVLTGGLGPTTDDFTREVVAEWAGIPLEFSESAWAEMGELYNRRGLTLRPAHRQQCYFPIASRKLVNEVGTAHGFALSAHGVELVVLPGPPREIQSMWPSVLEQSLKGLSPAKETELKIWTCLGVTESEAAEKTEIALAGSGWQIGYRAKIPYVKVKVWVPTHATDKEKWLGALEQAIGEWVVARDKEDLLAMALEKMCQAESLTIEDQVSQGQLAYRLSELRDANWKWPAGLSVHSGVLESSPKGPLAYIRPGENSGTFRVGLFLKNIKKEQEIPLPYKLTVATRRASLYVVESAAQWWFKNLNGSGA